MSTSFARIGDAGSLWSSSVPIEVGNGEMLIENGGAVMAGGGESVIGRESGDFAEVIVTGQGSLFECNLLNIGLDGSGVLRVLEGATAESDDGFIGRPGSNGEVEVSGVGSSWNTGVIMLDGDMFVVGGGSVNSTSSEIDLGDAVIDGSASSWTVEGDLTIQPGGSDLIIDGGELTVTEDLESSGIFADIFVTSGGTLSVGSTFTNGSLLAVSGNGTQISGLLVNNGVINMGFGSATINGEIVNNGNSGIDGLLSVNGVYRGSQAFRGDGATLLNGEYHVGDELAQVATHQWIDDDGEHDLGLAMNSHTMIEIASLSSFDRVIVDGELGLAGSLNVEMIGGFVPQHGSQYVIFSTNSRLGTFAGLAGKFGCRKFWRNRFKDYLSSRRRK